MKIRYHHPMLYSGKFNNYDMLCKRVFDGFAGDDIEIDHTWSQRGTQEVQFKSCDLLNTVETIKAVLDAEDKGFDGVMIGCSLDIGLKECREVASIPVVSSMETAMLACCTMGRKFCIVSFGEKARARQEQLIDEYGLRNRSTRVRSFEMSLSELGQALKTDEKKKNLRRVFMEEAQKAVTEEGAEVIIPGCGILAALCVSEGIHKMDAMEDVPVIDMFVPGLKMLEMQIVMKQKLNISISKRGLFQSPPVDVIREVRKM